MDEETFELCKDVEARTGWKDTPDVWQKHQYGVALYTSDYLLQKLPRYIDIDPNSYFSADLYLQPHIADSWNAGYRVGASYPSRSEVADTPLKALLELVIALHDAGELKTNKLVEPQNMEGGNRG